MEHHIVLSIVARILIPMIMLFALYVQFHGEYGPGGGFQAGVIFAASFILYGIIFGIENLREVIHPGFLRILAALGLLIYIGVGIIGILNGGRLVQVGRPEEIVLNPADDYVKAFVKDVNRAKVLRARTVMVKPDKFDGKEVKLSETYKVDADTYIEEFLPKVLQDRSTIVVVDKKGDTMGYITEKELAISLSKTSHNEPAKTS